MAAVHNTKSIATGMEMPLRNPEVLGPHVARLMQWQSTGRKMFYLLHSIPPVLGLDTKTYKHVEPSLHSCSASARNANCPKVVVLCFTLHCLQGFIEHLGLGPGQGLCRNPLGHWEPSNCGNSLAFSGMSSVRTRQHELETKKSRC